MKPRHPWKTILTLFASGAFVAAAALLAALPARAGQKSDSEVKIALEAGKPDTNGKQTITIQLNVNPGWHIYGNPVGNEDLAAAQTIVKVAGKNKPESVKVDYPKGKLKQDKFVGDYVVYEGKVAIKAVVQRAAGDTEPIEVSVRFQACNEKGVCLFPYTFRKSVP
jgi:thiol:disulfide interchange protein